MSDTNDGWVVDSQAATPATPAAPEPAEPSGDTQPPVQGATAEPSSPPAEGSAGVQDDAQDAHDDEPAPEGETAEQKAARDERGRFKRKDWQARIDKLTYEARQAQRERDEARQRIAEYEARARGEQPQQDRQPQASLGEGEPQEDQFDSYKDYVRAMAEWVADQRLIKAEQERVTKERESRALSAIDAYNERAKAFAAQVPDFREVVGNTQAPMSAAMHDAIVASERGPEIVYFLASHPQEADRLAQETIGLDPAHAAPLVRRALEALLRPRAAESGAAGVTPSRSTGPRPITPVGAGPVTADPSPDALPFGPSYVEAMNRKEAEARRRRMGA